MVNTKFALSPDIEMELLKRATCFTGEIYRFMRLDNYTKRLHSATCESEIISIDAHPIESYQDTMAPHMCIVDMSDFTIVDAQCVKEEIEQDGESWNIMFPYAPRIALQKGDVDIDFIIRKFEQIKEMAQSAGYTIKVRPDDKHPMYLYHHGDYPDTILLDKEDM